MVMRRLIGSSLVVLAAVMAVVLSARADASRAGYLVVCNPANPLASVERRFVQDAFLKKVTSWPTGDSARPVDLPPGSSVRRQFTEEVLRRSVEAVRIFWQQRIFAGRDLPPPEVGSDEEVIKFVMRDRGAIGYVSASASLNGAKVLNVR
jgi:ABC-type phosphate transport system substrate-binding protein